MRALCEIQDSTFDFERRRNQLMKYDRDVVANTIRAMTRVAEIQGRRQERFMKNRMKGRKTAEKLRVREGNSSVLGVLSRLLWPQLTGHSLCFSVHLLFAGEGLTKTGCAYSCSG